MSNSYFEFKQFTIHQERTAMKVGTDGTLLGAWAQVPSESSDGTPLDSPFILDIGTGTGLIALMMAQRFPKAQITAIDIDAEAVSQAQENVLASPFSQHVKVIMADARDFLSSEGSLFDAIVSNPPYFVDSLTCPDNQRTMARHNSTLTFRQLMHTAFGLLAPHGIFSVVIPVDCCAQLETEAHLAGFFPSRICMIKTTPRKAPKRCLMEFSKHPVNELVKNEGIIEISPNVRSDWYQELTRDFYIR